MTQTATTLAADVTATAEHLTLVAPLSDDEADGFFVQMGTELLEIIYRGTKVNPGVRHGRLGTTAAAHSSGAAVTPVKVVVQTDAPTAPPPATAGGAVQTVSRIGPFTVDWDTPGFTDNFDRITLTSIAAGSTVLDAWVVLTEPFDSDPSGNLSAPRVDLVAGTAEGVSPQHTAYVRRNFDLRAGAGADADISAATTHTVEGSLRQVTALSGIVKLMASYNVDNGTAAIGSFDVYALLATPA